MWSLPALLGTVIYTRQAERPRVRWQQSRAGVTLNRLFLYAMDSSLHIHPADELT